ncbi:polysaccharide deacetylase family protein [Evansella sp. AB-rgal1]|uniref:polysaccharide deacetylase family protein n=1 Tax=Evansella sp. AB-rgal1 TaxID=3242696 RepID=UPI00359F0927
MKKITIILCIVLALLVGNSYVLYEVSGSRSFQFFGELVTKIETSEKVVALTFDDGPGINTDEILHMLQTHDVKGTFYLTGSEIEEDFEKAVRIVKHGHEIGNHTYSHPRMVLKSPSFITEEIKETDKLIREIGYEGDIHFRPPYGKRLFILPYYLSSNDRKTILWDIEPETYPEIAASSDKITKHVVENVEPGSIILLHVMYESRRESLDAVAPIITALKDEGYTFVTVSQLLEYEE